MVMEAINIVLSIFMMIGLGMLLYHIGWLKSEHEPLLSTLVVRFALPFMIIDNLFSQFTKEGLLSNLVGLLIPWVSLLATWAFGMILARLKNIPKGRRGVFCCMFTFSNSVFIGVPVSLALFGNEALPYTLLYYIANTSLFWSLGHAAMCRDSHQESKLNLKKLLPLPLLVFFASVILILLGIRLPPFVLGASQYIGRLVTPLSMLFIGAMLMRMIKSKMIRWESDYFFVLAGRFLVAPALFLGCSRFIPMTPLMRNALLIQASMPVMSQTPIVAAAAGADAEYAAGGIAATTLGSLLSLPAYMALIVNFLQ